MGGDPKAGVRGAAELQRPPGLSGEPDTETSEEGDSGTAAVATVVSFNS